VFEVLAKIYIMKCFNTLMMMGLLDFVVGGEDVKMKITGVLVSKFL
jgi:hypothetical protein